MMISATTKIGSKQPGGCRPWTYPSEIGSKKNAKNAG